MTRSSLPRSVVGVALCGTCVALSMAWAVPQDSKSDEARKFLEERKAVLEKLVEIHRQAAEVGAGSLDAVRLAQKELLEAELDLAEQPSERVEILERLVKTMQDREEYLEQLRNARGGSPIDVLKARAARLKTQADLSRERRQLK